MLSTSLSKKRLVGVILFLAIMLPFFFLNRFPKLDIVRGDLDTVEAAESECFQGFCIERDPESSFLGRWWEFSVIYLRLVTVGMMFAFMVGAVTEAFWFPRSSGMRLLSGGTFKRTFKMLAIAPVMNVCSACIVPPAVAFHRRGAGIAGILALVQGSATMNLLAMFMVFAVFTPLLASTRVVLTIVGALFIGPIVAAVVRERREDETDQPLAVGVEAEQTVSGWGPVLVEGIRDWARISIRYLVQLGPIMLAAGFISGLAMQLFSADTVSTYLGNNLTGIVIAATVGILINVPLLFEIPLAALLLILGAGSAPVAVLLFVAAAGGPITFWGLARVMPKRAIATFAGATWMLSVVGGLGVWALTGLVSASQFGIR